MVCVLPRELCPRLLHLHGGDQSGPDVPGAEGGAEVQVLHIAAEDIGEGALERVPHLALDLFVVVDQQEQQAATLVARTDAPAVDRIDRQGLGGRPGRQRLDTDDEGLDVTPRRQAIEVAAGALPVVTQDAGRVKEGAVLLRARNQGEGGEVLGIGVALPSQGRPRRGRAEDGDGQGQPRLAFRIAKDLRLIPRDHAGAPRRSQLAPLSKGSLRPRGAPASAWK